MVGIQRQSITFVKLTFDQRDDWDTFQKYLLFRMILTTKFYHMIPVSFDQMHIFLHSPSYQPPPLPPCSPPSLPLQQPTPQIQPFILLPDHKSHMFMCLRDVSPDPPSATAMCLPLPRLSLSLPRLASSPWIINATCCSSPSPRTSLEAQAFQIPRSTATSEATATRQRTTHPAITLIYISSTRSPLPRSAWRSWWCLQPSSPSPLPPCGRLAGTG